MTGQDWNIEQQISNRLYGTRRTRKHKRKTAQYKGRKVHEGQVSQLRNKDKTRAKQGGVTKGNKEAGSQEHMVDTNKDKAMCNC